MSTLIHRRNHGATSAPDREAILTPDGVTVPDLEGGPTETARPSGWLAALRITTGFVFLWAFLDKLFGLGYATQSENAWIDGGSPTQGYLSGVNVGPFADTFNDIAGQAWADWLFMMGLLGIGAAVMLGVGLRIAAASGTVMMLLMWAAEWPLARHDAAGELTRSTNPLIESHIIYALVLIVLAVVHAGHHYGFGRMWARLPFVERHRAVLE
jgi:thiosulfate dehydrogenase (quinone) large subunit